MDGEAQVGSGSHVVGRRRGDRDGEAEYAVDADARRRDAGVAPVPLLLLERDGARTGRREPVRVTLLPSGTECSGPDSATAKTSTSPCMNRWIVQW
jgi:hypothetical protein